MRYITEHCISKVLWDRTLHVLVTTKDGPIKSYTRPVTEVILLRSERDFERMKTPLG